MGIEKYTITDVENLTSCYVLPVNYKWSLGSDNNDTRDIVVVTRIVVD